MSVVTTESAASTDTESGTESDGWRVGWEDGAVVLAYLLSLLLVGAVSSYRSKSGSISGYFLASRSMHWLPVGASLFASNVGSGHFVGLAGTAAKTGIAIASFELNASYILLLLGWVFVPVYMSSGVYTMPEYLRLRFGGQRIRVYLAVLSLILYIFIRISADLYAGALFITTALNKSSPEWLYISVVILLVIAAIFTIVGGLSVVIWTDFVQTALMIIGAFILMARSFSAVGGYERLIEDFFKAVPNKTVGDCGEPPADSMNFFRSVVPGESDLPWTGMMFGITVSAVWCWCTDQVIVQRTLASRNLSHAKGGCVVAAILKFLPQFFLIFPGMASRILYKDRVACVLPEECREVCGSEAGCTNIAYVELVLNLLPPGLTGLMLAVMMAALITSLTSIFNSASTIFTIDIWTRFRTRASDVEKLIVGRVFVVLLVAVSVVWIPVLQSSNSAQLFVYIQNVTSFLAPPICSVFVIAVLWKRANEQGAFWGLMVGLVIGITRFVMEFAYIVPPCGSGKEDPRPEVIKLLVGQVHYLHFGILLFFIVATVTVIVSLLTPPIPEPCLARLTFWTRYDRGVRPPLPSKKGTGQGESSARGVYSLSGEVNPTFSGMVEENGQLGASSSSVAEEPSCLLRSLQVVCGVKGVQDTTTLVSDKGAHLQSQQQQQVDAALDFITETERGKMYSNAGAVFVLVVAAFIWGFYA